MSNIKCITGNCEHNINGQCLAGVINVDKHAICTTRQNRNLGILEQNKVNMEAANDFDIENVEPTFIRCACEKCVYNKDSICNKQLTDLKDSFIKTKCISKQV